MPRSILTEKIARRGRHVFREYGVDPLERHFVDEVMTRAVVAISGSERASEVLGSHFGPGQPHRAYPVTQDHRLFAMVDRSVLSALSPEALGQPLIESLAGRSEEPLFALPGDTCREVALRLAALGLERLPVVADSVSRRLVGLVSRSDLLKPSHVLHDEDVRRERIFGFSRRSPEG
jgi:CBS domain-containing protein